MHGLSIPEPIVRNDLRAKAGTSDQLSKLFAALAPVSGNLCRRTVLPSSPVLTNYFSVLNNTIYVKQMLRITGKFSNC
jgi:hypothetical protein